MKYFFYCGVILLVLFEIALVYFIMPMPGSQVLNSLPLAYALYRWRWLFRIIFGLLAITGLPITFRHARFVPLLFIALWAAVTYVFNFRMTASHMFRLPLKQMNQVGSGNLVDTSKLIIGVTIGDEAAAYPIQYIAYHHRVTDTVGHKAIFITYCSVCRTGRVFEPLVAGVYDDFRLVGMDHFNAMFEDSRTKSWWRQANGEAVAGSMKGAFLPEVESRQMTLGTWLKLYPHTRIMQPDTHYASEYAKLENYDAGKMKGKLTRSDSLSWKDKSWVAGIVYQGKSKAYDWNMLKKNRFIADQWQGTHILLMLAGDMKSVVAFQLPETAIIQGDSIRLENMMYDLAGKSPGGKQLSRIPVYQEFWHSWRTFHPETETYPAQ
jgi:hypothetical protein